MISAAAAPATNSVVPGVLGFLVVAGLGLICYFLFRSLNKQLHKVVSGPRWREGENAATEAARPARPPRGLRARGMLPVQDSETGPPASPDGRGRGAPRR